MAESALQTRLRERLARINERIHRACARAGRSPANVTLVAVTKTVPADVAALLPDLGVTDLGESRPQELWHKAASVPAAVHWHLIGHLQRNKVERTLPLVRLIHSVDSWRLLEALDAAAANRTGPVDVLLEVNASGEAAKHGFAPGELDRTAQRLKGLDRVRVRGLMTMAAYEAKPERCRTTFVTLRELRDRLKATLPPPHDLAHLSMGMSNDFEVAVEEEATFVRIGTALFDGLVS